MPTVSSDDAVRLFADAIQPLLDSPTATGARFLDAFVAFVCDVRIDVASDLILLEWGASVPHLLEGFTDLRGGVAPSWGDTPLQRVGLSRQIMSGDGDDDPTLCLNLYFAPASGDEPSGDIEFEELDALDRKMAKFRAHPHVATLLASVPSRVAAFVIEAG